MNNNLIVALLLPLAFAAFDRLIGWGGMGRTKPVIIAVLGGGLLGYLVFGALPFAFLGLAWSVWRTLPFFGGSLAPEDGAASFACAIRTLLVVPVALLAYWANGDALLLASLLGAAATVIMVLRFQLGAKVAKLKARRLPLDGDPVAVLELISGGLFGVAITLYALLTAAS